MAGGREVGRVHELAWSPRLQRNIGLGMLATEIKDGDPNLGVSIDGRRRSLETARLPFIG